MSIKVIATNHTSFTVTNLDRVSKFFGQALGLQVEYLTPASSRVMEGVTGVDGADVRLAYVTCPGHFIEIFQYVYPENREVLIPRPCDAGFAHIAFEVDDMTAVIAAATYFLFVPVRAPVLVDMGTLDLIRPGAHPKGRGMLNCYLRDCDGLTVELMQYV